MSPISKSAPRDLRCGQLSLCRRDRARGFEFVGEQGTLRYNWTEERLLAVAADGRVSVLLDHRGYNVNQMYVDLLADFLGIVAGGHSDVAAGLQAGIDAIRVCCQVEAKGLGNSPRKELLMSSGENVLDRLFGLNGQVAVVAGGAGRIGSAVCKGLAEAGAKVCILDLAYEAASALAADLAAERTQAIAVRADAPRRPSWKRPWRKSPPVRPPRNPRQLHAVPRPGFL